MKKRIHSKTGNKIIRLNRRKAIREKCLNCSAWSYKQVELCPFLDCFLYPYHSGKGRQDPKARFKAIRQYCIWCCKNNQTEVRKCPAQYCPLHVYRRGRPDISPEMLFLSEKRPSIGLFHKDQALEGIKY